MDIMQPFILYIFLCEDSKRLYNVALYELRKFRSQNDGKNMSYPALDKFLRENSIKAYSPSILAEPQLICENWGGNAFSLFYKHGGVL
jgi:hypothetical protein